MFQLPQSNKSKSLILEGESRKLFVGDYDDMVKIQCDINTDLTSVLSWSNENSLRLNSDKTKMLVLCNARMYKRVNNFSIVFNNNLIIAESKLKLLGLIIDCKLTWGFYINDLIKRIYYRIKCLYNLKPYFSNYEFFQFCQSYIYSLTFYLASIWGTCSKTKMVMVDRAIKGIGRLILNKKRFESVSSIIMDEFE